VAGNTHGAEALRSDGSADHGSGKSKVSDSYVLLNRAGFIRSPFLQRITVHVDCWLDHESGAGIKSRHLLFEDLMRVTSIHHGGWRLDES